MEPSMPFDIQLTRKDGSIRTDLKIDSHQTPSVGDVIECSAGDQIVKARVTGVFKTSVVANIGQPLDMVDAEEI